MKKKILLAVFGLIFLGLSAAQAHFTKPCYYLHHIYYSPSAGTYFCLGSPSDCECIL